MTPTPHPDTTRCNLSTTIATRTKRRARILAVSKGMSFSALVEHALEIYLDSEEEPTNAV